MTAETSKPSYRHRNEYQRKAQKKYRKERSNERQALRQYVLDLEKQVSQIMPNSHSVDVLGMLPWQDIAIALDEANTTSKIVNSSLKLQVLEHQKLARLLMAYVGNLLATKTCLQKRQESWQHVSLLEDPSARKVGFDWITRQLYHNMSRVFEANKFPVTYELFFGVDLVPDEFQVIIRHQRVVTRPWREVTAAYHRFFIESNGFGYESLESLEDQNTLSDMDMVYRRRNIGNPAIGDIVQNYLHRQFVDEGKSVLVARNILSDGKYELGTYKRDASGWIVVERLTDSTALIKECWTVCPLQRGNETASWIEEASFYGIDLNTIPESMQFATIQQAVFRQGQSVLAKRNDFFDSSMFKS